MSRYDAESNFDDALGNRVRWSLRRSVVNTAPSAEVWMRIQEQVYAGEAGAEPRYGTPRQRVLTLAARQGPLSCGVGRLLDLGARTLRMLDEHTVSSETVWRPETETDVRLRLALQCVSSPQLLGQMLATY